MLRLAIIFLVLALIAGVLGFTGIAGGPMYAARVLFFIFVVISLLGFAGRVVMGRQFSPSVKPPIVTRGMGVKSTRLG